MVVNKKKVGKMPQKAAKKVDKVKTKVTRQGKNVSINNKGPVKRNKTVKPNMASKAANKKNKTRASIEKTKKVSKVSVTNAKSPKAKSKDNVTKAKPSEKYSTSPSNKGKLKETKATKAKATPEKIKSSKEQKISKPISLPISKSTTKKTTKNNTISPRNTRGNTSIDNSTNQSSRSKIESSPRKLKLSKSTKQSPLKETKNVNKQGEMSKVAEKGRPRKDLKNLSTDKAKINSAKKNSQSDMNSKKIKNAEKSGKTEKDTPKKSSPKPNEARQRIGDAKTKRLRKSENSPIQTSDKSATKGRVTRKDVTFSTNKTSKGTAKNLVDKAKGGTKKSSLKETNMSIKNDMSTNDHVKTRKSAGAEITNKDIKTSQNNTKKVKSSIKSIASSQKDNLSKTKRSLRNDPPVVSSNKVEKRKPKISKAKLAQRQIKKMQAKGLLGAPPRRAASLNAAAMVHFMYDTEIVGSTTAPSPDKPTSKSKDEDAKADKSTPSTYKKSVSSSSKDIISRKNVVKEETDSSRKSKSKVNRNTKSNNNKIQSESSDSDTESDSESTDDDAAIQKNRMSGPNKKPSDGTKCEKLKNKIIKTQKKKIVGGAAILKDIAKVSSPFISSSESEDDDDGNVPAKPKRSRNTFTATSSEESLDTSKDKQNKTPTKRKTVKLKKKPQKIKKRKKTLRDEFNMDIRDMIVKKRIASLNASAIMSASYSSSSAQNERLKMDESGLMTDSNIGEEPDANNYDILAAADMPTKHLSSLFSKIQGDNTSTLANGSLPSKTPSSRLSLKPNLTGSLVLNEPRRVGKDLSTLSQKHSSSQNKKKSKESIKDIERIALKEREKKKTKEKEAILSHKNEKLQKRSNKRGKVSEQTEFDEEVSEPQHIIVEIEDERIKSQLIASAMKKTSAGSKTSPTAVLPLKKRQVPKSSDAKSRKISSSKKNNKRIGSSREVIVTLSSSSSEEEDDDDYDKIKISSGSHSESSSSEGESNSSRSEKGSEEESEEEIEEICTEGARATANNQVIKYNHIRPSSTVGGVQGGLNPSEINKVDVIVDGRSHPVVAGMAYQVVQRVETISTTTAVVPRFRAPNHQQNTNDQVRKMIFYDFHKFY